MVTLREARPADAMAVLAVITRAAAAQGSSAYTDRQVEAWTHVEDPPPDYPIEDDDAHFVVAEADGRVVGVGDLDLAAGEIRAVYVHPDRMGQGIGTRLLHELETAARDVGHGEVSLLASLNAVPFYERHGYERAERVTQETSFGVELDVDLLRTELD